MACALSTIGPKCRCYRVTTLKTDEPEMVYRMAEYSIMLMRKYQLPVKQYVIFLKEAKPNMAVSIDTENHRFNYNLIRIAEADYQVFQKSDNPEVKMLGILANFGKEEPYQAVKSIIDGMQAVTKGDFAESRYFKQLRIFVQLRNNIEQQLAKAMETVSKFFKEENDFLYRKGETKGEERGEERGIKKGIEKGRNETQKENAREMKNNGIEMTLIAKITGLSVEEVKNL